MSSGISAEHEKVLKLVLKGWTYIEIGKKYGVSHQRVAQILIKHGHLPAIKAYKAKRGRARRALVDRNLRARQYQRLNNPTYPSHSQFVDSLNAARTDKERVFLKRCWVKYTRLRGNAQNRGTEFSVEWKDLTWPTHCPVFGCKLLYSNKYPYHEQTVSFDRFNPKLGYVAGNVFIMSKRANRIKNDSTPEELELLAKYSRKQAKNPKTRALLCSSNAVK